jgi:hypothetical protein
MPVRELTDKNPDGTRIGQATTDKLGFYGLTTPIVKPTGLITATDAATAITGAASIATILLALGLATT